MAPQASHPLQSTAFANGMIERFFRTLKEECLWHHRFTDRDEAFLVIAAWLEKYLLFVPQKLRWPKAPVRGP